MKNLYNNFHAFRKINQLAFQHHRARIRKKNLKRLKRNYDRFKFVSVLTKIYGDKLKLPKKKRSKILKLISRRKVIDVLPSLRMSNSLVNSLVTPIDTMMEYSRLRLNGHYIPAKLKLNKRLPDYERKIELKEGNIFNEQTRNVCKR